MARFPLITSPCPLRFDSAPRPGQDFCGRCQRRVHNLDGMSEAERRAFIAGCEGEVCVFYTIRLPRAVRVAVGAGLAASVLGASSAAARPTVEAFVQVEQQPDASDPGAMQAWEDATRHALPLPAEPADAAESPASCDVPSAADLEPVAGDLSEEIVISGGTVADGARWADEHEAASAASRSALPEIDAVEWLPTPAQGAKSEP